MSAMGGGFIVTTQRQLSRQWVPMVGGSCDVRMGEDALHSAAKVLRDSVGRPHVCVVVMRAGEDAVLVEDIRRQVVDAGFEYRLCELQAPLRTLEAASMLCDTLIESHATADDLCFVVGDADLISVASFVCGAWCEGMPLVAMPLDEVALLEGALVPRSLGVGDESRMLSVRPAARHAILDLTRSLSVLEDEASRHARVLMVGAAMASSEKEFSELWDRAADLMADDGATLCTQLIATAKARGKLAASTAAAMRSSLRFGQSFAWALKGMVPDASFATLLAEGMRFCARISVAQGKLPLDDMLAQDELLEMLGIEVLRAYVSADELIAAFEAERRKRSRRNMLEVPLAIGRVRLATVEDELIEEHVRAWCMSHAPEV